MRGKVQVRSNKVSSGELMSYYKGNGELCRCKHRRVSETLHVCF